MDPRAWRERLLGPAVDTPAALTLLGVGLVDASGTGLYLAGSAVFFSVVIGLSAGQVGVGLSIAGLLGLVAAPSLGWCADRWGPRRVLVLLHLWRAAAFLLLAAASDFATFVIAAAMIGVGQQALTPVYQALVEEAVGAGLRVTVMARTRAVYNVGFSIGGVAATLAIAIGTEPAFNSMVVGNAACCLVAALLLARVTVPAVVARRSNSRSPLHLRSLRDGRYLAVAGVNGVLSLHITLLAVGIPLWVTLYTTAPRAIIGMLLVVNTVLAVALQVRASRDAESVAGSIRSLRRSGVALATSCVLIGLAPPLHAPTAVIALLVSGVVALTASELLQSAGGWGLSYGLAPPHRRAEFLAAFGLGTSAQFVLGPVIVTLGVVEQGIAGWLVLAACLLLFVAVVGPVSTAAQRRPALLEATS